MRFCDAHNHIHSLNPAETAAALARAREADVTAMLVCATMPQDWTAVAKSAALYPEIIPFFGLHPWHAAGAAADWQQALERQLEEVPSGVGEIGLDRSKRAGDFGAQLAAFDFQLALAAKLDRPAAIHCVRAWGPLLELLGKRRPRRFLLHSYGGAAELIPPLAALGAYFSFNGDILDPKRKRLAKALAAAPRDRILFETESPQPAAAARRDWRAGPEGVRQVVGGAARLLGVSETALAQTAWRNAVTFLEDMI